MTVIKGGYSKHRKLLLEGCLQRVSTEQREYAAAERADPLASAELGTSSSMSHVFGKSIKPILHEISGDVLIPHT